MGATEPPRRYGVSPTCAVVLLIINLSSLGFAADRPGPKLPDLASVSEMGFSAPGCGSFWSRHSETNEQGMAILASRRDAWVHRAESPYAEFVFEIRTGEKTGVTIRAGRAGDGAFLQTAAAGGGFYVREITLAELSRLLRVFNCDLSIAFLRSDQGYYRKMVDRALSAQSSRVKSKSIDGDGARRLLEFTLQYARANPQDTSTTSVLRSLLSLTVDDYVQEWYVVELHGCGYHCWARMLVGTNGKAMPATPQNCLTLCRSRFDALDKRENAEKLFQKVLEGSGLGKIVGKVDDIPGYRKNPMPKEKETEVRPMHEHRIGGRLAYRFYVYEPLGGRVWQCSAIVDNAEPVWQMTELATDVGDARYIF